MAQAGVWSAAGQWDSEVDTPEPPDPIVNSAPTVTITGATSASHESSVTLGSTIVDSDAGDSHTYTWRKVSGSGTLSATNTPSITVTGASLANQENTVVGLVVNDGTVNSQEDLHTIAFSAEPYESVPVIVLTPNTLNFEIAAGSYFTPPTAIAKDDDQDDAEVNSVDVDAFDTDTPGTYVFTYDHTDNQGNAAPQIIVTVQVIRESVIINNIASTEYTVNDNMVTAFAGRENRNIFTFTPADKDGIAIDSNGCLDFTESGVDKVEVWAGSKIIDSSTNAINWIASELSIELGALNMETTNKSIYIVVYLNPDTKGIVIAGPGLKASIIVQFKTVGE